MKKIFSLLLAASLAVSAQTAAFAKSAELSVKVDGRTIAFREEQGPVIESDRMYVPIRRVLESMGASVSWNDEEKSVTINSYDNITRLILTINNPEITVYTFTSVLHADKSSITSDVAPIIINDRTMLPIRVIAEALGSTVEWDEDTLLTTITTKKAKIAAKLKGIDAEQAGFSLADAYAENIPHLSISSDAKDIKAGDTVAIKVKLDGLNTVSDTAKLSSTTISVLYDSENFDYIDFTCIGGDGKEISADLSADNGEFYDGCAKTVSLFVMDKAYTPSEDGTVVEVIFEAKNDKGGTFALSDGITNLGNNTEILITDGEEYDYVTLRNYDELFIDTTEITVK